MPFTRFITSCFLVVILLIAIFGPGDHPWFTSEALWLAVLFAFCVWLMSLKRDFVLNMMAICFSAFFLQRIVVIYFRPDQIDFLDHLEYSSSVFVEAILFCIGISIAILIGHFFAASSFRSLLKQDQKVVNFDRFFGVRYNFERLFKLYSLLLCCSLIFEVFLMVRFHVGVMALDFDRQFAPLLRVVQIVQSLYFLPILVLASGKFSSRIRKTALCLTALILMKLVFLDTSKGALLSLCITFFVCLYSCGKLITRKYFIIGGALFFLTIFVLAPLTIILRASVVGLTTGVSNLGDVFQMFVNNYMLVTDKQFFSFMLRLGAFDWLTGLMNAGREAFMPMANISNDLIGIINSLVPGDFIENPLGGMTISKLMPHILRGWDLGSYAGHAENMSGAGMAYLYFGKVGGVLFFFVWSFVLVRILRLSTNSIMNVLFFLSIVITYFLGGNLITSVVVLYQGLALFILLIFASEVFTLRPPHVHPIDGVNQ